ncbi:hypothetical protein FGADI_9982 [Fusarium gaditjirri]|uniref:Uncharacterized protein n=1 Tax=Fusarium gaditjirri TaxID=282569 RepID=A0A8H4WRU8_9HYPO|nr:hypothetical protein FGADI_9982 [Fusarium gaditjirri]
MINVNSPSKALNPNRTRRLLKGQGVIHSITPCVYFFCLGIGFNEDGQPYSVHRSCYAGDTRERLDSWPEFNVIRIAARDAHIGAAYVEYWLEFYQNIQKLDDEATKAGLETFVVRKTISEFALEGIAVPDKNFGSPSIGKTAKPYPNHEQSCWVCF